MSRPDRSSACFPQPSANDDLPARLAAGIADHLPKSDAIHGLRGHDTTELGLARCPAPGRKAVIPPAARQRSWRPSGSTTLQMMRAGLPETAGGDRRQRPIPSSLVSWWHGRAKQDRQRQQRPDRMKGAMTIDAPCVSSGLLAHNHVTDDLRFLLWQIEPDEHGLSVHARDVPGQVASDAVDRQDRGTIDGDRD